MALKKREIDTFVLVLHTPDRIGLGLQMVRYRHHHCHPIPGFPSSNFPLSSDDAARQVFLYFPTFLTVEASYDEEASFPQRMHNHSTLAAVPRG